MSLLIEGTESQRRSVWNLAACVVTCLSVLACQPSQLRGERDAEPGEQAEVVVAWVDGEPVGLEEVLSARRRGGGRDREAGLEAALLGKVACLEARRQELHKRPEIERALRDVRLEAERREGEILRAALKKEMLGDLEIPEEELRQAYEEDERPYRDRQLRLRTWSFEGEHEARSALDGAGGPDALDLDKATEVGPVFG